MSCQRVRKISLCIGVLSLMMGCSSGRSSTTFTPSFSIPVTLEAAKDINTFQDQQARPVVLRVYQLVDIGNFQKASFIQLYDAAQATLAETLVDFQTLPAVIPGEQRRFELTVQQQTKYIAILAEFSQYDTAQTKAYVALVAEPEEHPMIIQITNNKVEVTQPVDSSWWDVL